MTREEAIKFMKAMKRGLKSTGKDYPYRDEYIPKMKEACEMAIKALEQEPILDKISTEIMQLDYDLEDVDYDYDDMAQTETVHIICREQVLQIIDKYKAGEE